LQLKQHIGECQTGIGVPIKNPRVGVCGHGGFQQCFLSPNQNRISRGASGAIVCVNYIETTCTKRPVKMIAAVRCSATQSNAEVG